MEGNQKFTDQQLLSNLTNKTTQNEAIRYIYRQYYDGLQWFVVNNSGSEQDAEDIFQEVVLNFVELVRLQKFRGEASIKTFLFALNKNIWLNELKRRGRAVKRELRYETIQDKKEPDAATVIIEKEAVEELMQVIDKLGDNCKKILLLYYYENLSVKEMLEQLDYENEQVIRNKKYKCLKQLENWMKAQPLLSSKLKTLLHG